MDNPILILFTNCAQKTVNSLLKFVWYGIVEYTMLIV